MKKIILFSLTALLLFGCKNKPANDVQQMDTELSEIVPSTEYEKDGITYQRATNDTLNASPTHPVIISLRPDTSLLHVKSSSLNKTYCDNTATITVLSRSTVIYKHTLNKKDFSGLLDANLTQNAILYSVSLLGVEDDEVKIEVDFCVPHSDEQMAFEVELPFNSDPQISRQKADDDLSSPDQED